MKKIIKLSLFFVPLVIIILLGISTFLIKGFDGGSDWREQTYLDENGVPAFDTTTRSGEHLGKQRNVIIIYRVAKEFYNDFLRNGNETSKKLFLNNANWLMENTLKKENYSIYEYSYIHPGSYGIPSGWHDSLAQGRIINVMLKAHNLTNDKKYLNEAKLLSNAFFVQVSDGGLTYKTKNNGWWYEHFAHKDGPHQKILNGMMFTLMDIYSLYEYTNDPDVKFLFDQGITALKNDIPNYDFFGYTYYDSLKRTAGYNYHKIHIQYTKLLYDITNEKIFMEYHTKWKSCEEPCHFILRQFALLFREIEELK